MRKDGQEHARRREAAAEASIVSVARALGTGGNKRVVRHREQVVDTAKKSPVIPKIRVKVW